MPGTRKLGRPSDQRRAMLRAMVTYLLENGKIETTVTRAKEVAAMTEKMVTLGKKANTIEAAAKDLSGQEAKDKQAEALHVKRQVFSYVTKEAVAKKLFDEIAPNYAERASGYTRVVKIGPRRGDAAEMAVISLV